MTDAERIAEYLLAIQWANISPDGVRAYVATPRNEADPDSCYEAVTGLMAILSDVRREEREAATERCLDILVRVGITAMEAGHTSVGKYIAAASTQIRGCQ